MAIRYRKPNVKLPFGMEKYIDPYLEQDEEVIDYVRETIIPAFDFRWIILTNQRLIQATYKWFDYEFHDVRFEGIDMQFSQGFFYDAVRIKSMTDDYNASFYRFNRPRTEEFMQEIEDERDAFQLLKKKNEKRVEHEITEQLIVEGVLPSKEDSGHEEKLKKEKEEKKKQEQEEKPEQPKPKDQKESSGCPPVETIKELNNLKKEGIITEEEYQQKKKELLGRL